MDTFNPHLTPSDILVIVVWVVIVGIMIYPILCPFVNEMEEDERQCDDPIVREGEE
jgi:hypothetical protein